MNCPDCGGNSKVLEARSTVHGGEMVRVRRRECMTCHSRFNSYECYDMADVELAFRVSEVRKLIKEASMLLISIE